MRLVRSAIDSVPSSTDDVLAALVPKVRRWLHRILGATQALDDVTQDALIEIARALPGFRGESAVETFAYRITIRVAGRALKRMPKEEVSLELVPGLADRQDPHSRLAQRDMVRALYRALDELSTKRRLVFVLCEIEGLSPAEAANVLGEGAATVRSRLRRARDQISERLRGDPRLAWLDDGESR